MYTKYNSSISREEFDKHACMHAKSLQSCLTLCDPMDSSPPGSSVHRILQARIRSGLSCPSLLTSICSLITATTIQIQNRWSLLQFFSESQSQPLATADLLWETGFHLSKMSFREKHKLCGFFWCLSLNAFETYLYCFFYQQVVPLYRYVIFQFMDILFVDPFTNSWSF